MTARFRLWLWQLLVAIDQLAGTWIFGWSYVWLGGGRNCPQADETISSVVGKASMRGAPWARRWERRINRLAVWLGEQPNHCRRSIEWDEGKETSHG